MHTMRGIGDMPGTSRPDSGDMSDTHALLAYNGKGYQFTSNERNKGYCIWYNVAGLWGEHDPDAGSGRYQYDSRGFSFGLDYRVGENAIAGIGMGSGRTDLGIEDSTGSGDIESKYVSIYASYFNDGFYLDGLFSCGWHDYTIRRSFDDFAVSVPAVSDHSGNSWSASGDLGYSFKLNEWSIQPFVGLNYIILDESGFVEEGLDEMSFTVKKRSTEYLNSRLGIHLGREFEKENMTIIPEFIASWNYDFRLDDGLVSAAFTGEPNATLTIETPQPSRHSMTLGAALHFLNKSGLGVALKYNETFQENYHVGEISGALQVVF
jgi:outer membrane autotransporter protein